MSILNPVCGLLALALLANPPAREITRDQEGNEYFKGRIVVKLRPAPGPPGDDAGDVGRSAAQLQILSNLGLTRARELFILGKDAQAPAAPTADRARYRRARAKLAGIFIVDLDPNEDVVALCKRLQQNPGIHKRAREVFRRVLGIPRAVPHVLS